MSSKALLIAEGEKRELAFFTKIQKAYGLEMEIVPFCGNVSMLYDEMKKSEFMADIKALLREKTSDPQQIKLLNDSYSDIYLVFDFDPQHSIRQRDGETVDEALLRNAARVTAKAMEMARELTNSTEPTLGQLYINYPEIESFRDADDSFDKNFALKKVPLRDLCKEFGGKGYKEISTRGTLARKRLSDFTAENFSLLALMQVYKLRLITEGVWGPLSYDEFRSHSAQENVLQCQEQEIRKSSSLWILNTSLFLIFDYKGQPFYNEVNRMKSGEAQPESHSRGISVSG